MKGKKNMKKFNCKIFIPLIVGVVVIVGIAVFLILGKFGKDKTTSRNELLLESTDDTEPEKTDSTEKQSGNGEQNTTTENKETPEDMETSGEDFTTEYITELITEPSLEGETETTFVSEYEPEILAPWTPIPDNPTEILTDITLAPTEPITILQTGEWITDYVFIEDKNPTYVMGYYQHESKNVAGKIIECLYLKDVQHEYEWDEMGDEYYLKWNDWMYFSFDTKDTPPLNGGTSTNGFINKDEEYEGLKLDENSGIDHIIDVKTASYYSRNINNKNINVDASFIKPYFYDKTTQTITTKSNEFVSKDIYLKYILKDLNLYELDQTIKDILIEEAGYLYDFYVFWYKNLKGTEFDGFVYEGLSWNGIDKVVTLYYNDESYGYDIVMEAIDRVSKK